LIEIHYLYELMTFVHEFLKTSPFDLYALHLFGLVVRLRSFTKAAEVAGLTQSAITRQIQQLEESLGVNLLDRTTRSVHITPAGHFLSQEASSLLGNAEQTFVRLRQEFANAKKEVRVGVSRSIAQSHLPGLFHANLKHEPHLGYRVTCLHSSELISALERHDLDAGILCPPKRLPTTLRVTHRFNDTFTVIAPSSLNETAAYPARSHAGRIKWAIERNWLMFDRSTNTGDRLHGWMLRQGWKIEPAMELDSFDLIIQLVALGMGVSLVPIRALALFGQKHHIQRLTAPDPFVRELVVVTRRHRKLPGHLKQFIEHILF
jgi:DNA-binding transcriptional LysR family regulator